MKITNLSIFHFPIQQIGFNVILKISENFQVKSPHSLFYFQNLCTHQNYNFQNFRIKDYSCNRKISYRNLYNYEYHDKIIV